MTPDPFESVGRWYADFSQTTDEEVMALLAAARSRNLAPPPAAHPVGLGARSHSA